ARTDASVKLVFQPHLNLAIRAVLLGVGAPVSEDVVRRHLIRDSVYRLAEVVGVGEGCPTRVGRQRLQRFLLSREARELLRHATAREGGDAAAAALSRA